MLCHCVQCLQVETVNGNTGFVIRTDKGSADGIGTTLGNLGDVNGDGTDDIAIGNAQNYYTGAADKNVFVVFGDNDFGSQFFIYEYSYICFLLTFH